MAERSTQYTNGMDRRHQSVEYWEDNRNASCGWRNAFGSKRSEHYAAIALYEFCGYPLCWPDIEVVDSSQKNWDADLQYNELDPTLPPIHVKVCTDVTKRCARGDFSWTFQLRNKNGRGGRDKLFDLPPNAPDVLMLMHMASEYADAINIVATIPWTMAREHLKPPVKKELIGLKKCIYYRDLLEAYN